MTPPPRSAAAALTAADAVESARFALTTSGDLDRRQVVTAQGDPAVRSRTSARGTVTVRAGGYRIAARG